MPEPTLLVGRGSALAGSRMMRFLEDAARGLRGERLLRVGFLENATYPDGTPVAMIAAIQEWGTVNGRIPSRPFFRTMIKQKQSEWGPATANLLRTNGYDAQKTLHAVGFAIEGQLRDSIVNGGWVPNAPATVTRKGFDRPLIDTSNMLNSIDHEVVTGTTAERR